MTQEKMRKVITACVSAATVLFVLLLGFLVYQWIYRSVLDKRIAAEEKEIAQWEQEIAEADSELSWLLEGWGKDYYAFKYGYVYPEDNQ